MLPLNANLANLALWGRIVFIIAIIEYKHYAIAVFADTEFQPPKFWTMG